MFDDFINLFTFVIFCEKKSGEVVLAGAQRVERGDIIVKKKEFDNRVSKPDAVSRNRVLFLTLYQG